MDHSAAIMQDAEDLINKAVSAPVDTDNMEQSTKRKRDDDDSEANGDNKRHKKRDMGRGEYMRQGLDKREKIAARKDHSQATYAITFTKEEIDADQRRPKRKVAVMIGYAGTGYKGLQISPTEKTIEGELFQAFVKAGAISKANADDPKKAGLIRCARTDKGVHAAGNMLSLKLIIDDEDIVEKINSNLPDQIRVWGIERTVGSFSCYQACDSRWYEYLIPSYAFLPPHPSSFLGKKLESTADEVDRIAYDARQAEVKDYWAEVEKKYIDPIVATIDEDIRGDVISALKGEDEDDATKEGDNQAALEAAAVDEDSEVTAQALAVVAEPQPAKPVDESGAVVLNDSDRRVQRLRAATRELRRAYMTAKRHYRLPEERIERVRAALAKFVGTKNYHNYTVQKSFNDPSAKRNVKSFVVNGEPILIGEGEDKTEWLSLKVHGQSFMMHQIRKMIGMVSLLVRCGSSLETMNHSFTAARYSIPKVPGLGLMLERPVFDSYNNFQAAKHEREPLIFAKYETNIEAFKRKEIYARMFSEEEENGEFSRFFNHVDNFREPCFLFVTSKGFEATEGAGRKIGYGDKV